MPPPNPSKYAVRPIQRFASAAAQCTKEVLYQPSPVQPWHSRHQHSTYDRRWGRWANVYYVQRDPSTALASWRTITTSTRTNAQRSSWSWRSVIW